MCWLFKVTQHFDIIQRDKQFNQHKYPNTKNRIILNASNQQGELNISGDVSGISDNILWTAILS